MQTQFNSHDFRRAMGKFATGVTVVTTRKGETAHGMTANAFTSVSLDPPLVLVSVDKRSNTHRFIQTENAFGINFLRADQRDLSNHFAGKPNIAAEAKLNVFWHGNIPLLDDCLVNIACRLWASYDGGDHTLYVGEVIALNATEGSPLLFFGGDYRNFNKD